MFSTILGRECYVLVTKAVTIRGSLNIIPCTTRSQKAKFRTVLLSLVDIDNRKRKSSKTITVEHTAEDENMEKTLIEDADA